MLEGLLFIHYPSMRTIDRQLNRRGQWSNCHRCSLSLQVVSNLPFRTLEKTGTQSVSPRNKTGNDNRYDLGHRALSNTVPLTHLSYSLIHHFYLKYRSMNLN